MGQESKRDTLWLYESWAMTSVNNYAAFKATELFSLGRNVFTYLDFTPREVTDQLVNLEYGQTEIDWSVEGNGYLVPPQSILELSCQGSNQGIQLKDPGAKGTHRSW